MNYWSKTGILCHKYLHVFPRQSSRGPEEDALSRRKGMVEERENSGVRKSDFSVEDVIIGVGRELAWVNQVMTDEISRIKEV